MNTVAWYYDNTTVDTCLRVVETKSGQKRLREDDNDFRPNKVRIIDPDNLIYQPWLYQNNGWGSPNPNFVPAAWGSTQDSDDDSEWGEPEPKPEPEPEILEQVIFVQPEIDIEIGNDLDEIFDEPDHDELYSNYGPGYTLLLKLGELGDLIKQPPNPTVYRRRYEYNQLFNGFSGTSVTVCDLFYQLQDKVRAEIQHENHEDIETDNEEM